MVLVDIAKVMWYALRRFELKWTWWVSISCEPVSCFLDITICCELTAFFSNWRHFVKVTAFSSNWRHFLQTDGIFSNFKKNAVGAKNAVGSEFIGGTRRGSCANFEIRDGIFQNPWRHFCLRDGIFWYPVDLVEEKMLSETLEMTAFWKMLSKKCCRMTPFLNLHFTMCFSMFSLKMLSDDGKKNAVTAFFCSREPQGIIALWY